MARYFREEHFALQLHEPVRAAFRRLALQRGWLKLVRVAESAVLESERDNKKNKKQKPKMKEQRSDEYSEEFMAFNRAVLEEAEENLVSFPTRLKAAQHLIEVYGLNEDGEWATDTLSQCRALLSEDLFANIYDFVDGRYVNHGSLLELRRYTKANNLYFPKEAAKDKAHPELKLLLRHLFH